MSKQTFGANMVRLYFTQGQHYMSESKGELLPIAAMPPRHAANAAEKLLNDAGFWAEEASVTPRLPKLWMMRQPLFKALAARAELDTQ